LKEREMFIIKIALSVGDRKRGLTNMHSGRSL
jgi:hypothetical protein